MEFISFTLLIWGVIAIVSWPIFTLVDWAERKDQERKANRKDDNDA